ncbi:hypothetical protein M2322_000434 [Rhodoblastus acidophilus]|uniref:hypothetical protein n=1 Tax=Rhodoblastus acidophilus TaxID=1074 RepID=UPI0022245806|nr:hypothetical protein [Rhodoblastus acidophilus]MCW2314914.1 hypothetical protein [Rhodoblastus acidophilus]
MHAVEKGEVDALGRQPLQGAALEKGVARLLEQMQGVLAGRDIDVEAEVRIAARLSPLLTPISS